MSRLENLKDNLTLLAHSNSTLARQLVKFDKKAMASSFEFCDTDRNELNLFYKKRSRSYTFHNPSGAVKECADWLSNVEPHCQVLYIFGCGLGYSLFRVRKWLEKYPKLQIVYIEPLLPVLFHLFQTEIGNKLVAHPRIHLYRFKNKPNLDRLLDHLAAEFSLYKAQVISSPIYRSKYPRTANYIAQNLPLKHDELSTVLNEGSHSRNNFFRNFTNLATNLNGRYNASNLQGAFKNVPCIIVGAGPSLQKNIDILKTLKSKAIILAGSSAISGITQQGITPHLGNYFDPYPRLYDRFLTSTAFELPTVHCARTFFEVSRKIHGPQIYIRGSMNTPVVSWVEEELGFHGSQNEELISVTASNTFLAQLMGCSPIIYVGVDLAYTDNKSYMQGISKETAQEEDIESQEKQSSTFEFNKDEMSTDIHGESIKTRHGWLVESQIISMLALKTPHLRFINATEGGIGFTGISNLPLQEVNDWFLKKNYPIEEMIHSALLPTKVQDKKNPSKSLLQLRELLHSLGRCLKYYKIILKELRILFKENKTGNLGELKTDFLIDNMAKIGHELAYQYLLKRYHQLVDIPKLKNKYINKNLSIDAPITLSNEIALIDMVGRFKEYKQICEELRETLKSSLKKIKVDPW
ncbi:MAG: hypothetical protein S4CHLAM6_15370 [Chlamydiae bacterium]|nr:hypothetical protein [Chlamydiota bacterium]